MADLTAGAIHAELMLDPAYRAEYERTEFAAAVAALVIRYRADRNLTQAELARRLGMRQPQVARLEAGDREPQIQTLQRLADVLGVTVRIAPHQAPVLIS